MSLRCPDCCSEEALPAGRGTRLKCGNCGAAFAREEALVTVAEAEQRRPRPGGAMNGRSLMPTDSDSSHRRYALVVVVEAAEP